MIRVTIRRQGSNQDEVHEFTLPQITIGRVDKNHVVLPNNRVSSVHARVLEGDDGIVLIDNNSTNGTFVNSELVRGPVVLGPADAVDVGVFTLHFERVAEGGARPSERDEAPLEEYGGYPSPDGDFDEPPELDGPAELTPADPIDADAAGPPKIQPVGPAGSGAYRVETELDLPEPEPPEPAPEPALARPGASRRSSTLRGDPELARRARRDAPPPREPEPEPQRAVEPRAEPPRSLAEGLELAFRQVFEAMLGEPPGPQAQARALTGAREAVERNLSVLDPRQRRQWAEWLAREVAGVGPLTDILADAAVSEVLVAGASYIEVRRGEQRARHPARFSCERAVHLALERLIGAKLTPVAPIVEGVTQDGVAVHAVGAPVAAGGPLLALSRAAGEPVTLARLVERKALSQPAADALSGAIQRGRNVLLAATSRADAAALLGALASELPGEPRIVAAHRSPLAPALASRALVLDAARDPVAALRSALRLRPDWLVVQDLGGAEAAEVCASARRSGGATVAALVAEGVEEGLERLQAMLALSSPGADATGLRAYAAGCFDVALALRRSLTGRDIVVQIAELRDGDIVEIFARDDDEGALRSTGVKPTL